MFVCFTLHEYFRVDDFSLLLLLLFNSWLAEYTSCQLTAQAVLLSTPPHTLSCGREVPFTVRIGNAAIAIDSLVLTKMSSQDEWFNVSLPMVEVVREMARTRLCAISKDRMQLVIILAHSFDLVCSRASHASAKSR